ncbi:Hypoxic response protein 1 [Enhygromyxa salina]|uniref:Hypoxic response protein 1 n=1 Tax=Enhygromyxa salina TaxID=215803 RepID=A0A2S9YBT1_9BACT|nr:CBS domain-containing protein [Enhygromyxa salina]PRQ02577.1 Hypoxic response protein 1 [Enhygromyxa salina]
MNVKKLMSKPVATCRPGDTLETAAQRMSENDCGALPVVDDSGSAIGMVTDRDICMTAYSQDEPLREIEVSKAMSKQLFTCHADDKLDKAERLMSQNQIRRVPVIDANNRPIGILTLNDIARYAQKQQKDGIDREVVQTFDAICQPRPQAQARAQPRSN